MLSILCVLATVIFITMMSPGPDMMLLIRYSNASNRSPAVACVTGICCGLVVHVALSIIGLAAIVTASDTLYSAIKLTGAIYLIYIGLRSLFSGAQLNLSAVKSSDQLDTKQVLLHGFCCNILNPKVTLFILAVFTQIIEPSTPTAEKIAYGVFILIESFVVWNLFVVLIRTPVVLRLLNSFQVAIDRVIGVILVCFGGALI